MGNCSGFFANCTGENDPSNTKNAVRRIDADKMEAALRANEADRNVGQAIVGIGNDQMKNTVDGNHYNQNVFGQNSATPQMKASEYTKDVREQRPAMQLDSGAVYEGEWLNGVRDG